MKKFCMSKWLFASLLALVCSISFWVFALNITDYFRMVTPESSFGYSQNDKLSITSVSRSGIVVESPVIKNWNKNIVNYLFAVSLVTGFDQPDSYWCFNDVRISGNKFSVNLNSEWLFEDKVYYLYAFPIDIELSGANWSCSTDEALSMLSLWSVWDSSLANGENPCFKIRWQVYWEWDSCTASHTTASSSNTNSVYSIAWVSHTYSWNKITLTWNSFSDVRMNIYYENPNKAWEFIFLAAVNTDDRSYTFTAKHDWDHLIRFEPADGTQPIHYTAHYTKTSSPQITPAVKPVVVWPKENILLVLFGTLILYVVYRLAKRKI